MEREAVNPESQEPREMLPGDSGKLSLQKKGGNKIKQRKYTYLKPGDIRPKGWLRKQLRLQAEGLSGHLDLIWPEIGRAHV